MKESLTPSSNISKRLSPRKLAFITGTLLLTSTGFICRILGFFYRIFMSRTIGAEGLGIYNMVHPIFSICFAVCAGSIQTALSQYVAANQSRGKAVFKTGLGIAMGMSFLLAWGIYGNAGFLAEKFLLEPRCAPYLPVMAVSVPFAALHACINGYYYGMQKARVPAFSQVAEQVIRMGAVFLMAGVWLDSGREITVSLAVYGHLIGEMASAAFTVFCLGFFPPAGMEGNKIRKAIPLSFRETAAPLMALALPLMGNRLILNVLGSAEAIWIPNKLMSFGLTNSEALSIYGVLTSMALPFILFLDELQSCVDILEKAKTIGLFGIGSSLLAARDMYLKFLRLNKPCICNDDWHSQLVCARNLTKEDVAVIFSYSGLTKEMLTCARILKEKDVPIITVTRFAENELTRLADCKLYVSAKELLVRTAATASRISQLNIIDILFTAYVKNNYEKNISRLKSNVITKDII